MADLPPEPPIGEWQRLYVNALTRHHANIDAVLDVIAHGGDTKAVVSVLIAWLDGMDALDDEDGLIKRAWLAAGGTEADYPVVTFVLREGPAS